MRIPLTGDSGRGRLAAPTGGQGAFEGGGGRKPVHGPGSSGKGSPARTTSSQSSTPSSTAAGVSWPSKYPVWRQCVPSAHGLIRMRPRRGSCFRCGLPAERPVLAAGRVAGRHRERMPLCVDSLQLLLEDVRRFWEGMPRGQGR